LQADVIPTAILADVSTCAADKMWGLRVIGIARSTITLWRVKLGMLLR
jgi:hypothetical protein